jgi:hypothetical protein
MNPLRRPVGPALSLVAAAALLVARAPTAQADATLAGLYLSAPIVPNTTVLYPAEGAAYPASLAGEQALAGAAAVTFDTLLAACPTLTPTGGGTYDIDVTTASPSLARLQLNYDSVARCAYEHYTAKPYWIPALVDHVDICAASLGAGWRLPTEADVLALSADDLSALAGAYDPSAPTFSSLGGMYFALKMYVRGAAADGAGHFPIKVANLNPGASVPIDDLRDGSGAVMDATSPSFTRHNEGGVVLRCVSGSL